MLVAHLPGNLSQIGCPVNCTMQFTGQPISDRLPGKMYNYVNFGFLSTHRDIHMYESSIAGETSAECGSAALSMHTELVWTCSIPGDGSVNNTYVWYMYEVIVHMSCHTDTIIPKVAFLEGDIMRDLLSTAKMDIAVCWDMICESCLLYYAREENTYLYLPYI